MSERRLALLGLLADGALHSGEDLARRLGVTRAAVAKQVQSLAPWGVELEALPRRGYRLAAPLELLDAAAVTAALGAPARARLEHLEVEAETDSTNARLLAEAAPAPGRWRARLAEFQNAGRGRRGRGWLAPFGSGLCLSFAWLFREAPAELAALSLATGVATLRALRRYGIEGLALKWPNDVLLGEAKLGGILCELRVEAAGPAHVVIGIGLNVRLPGATRAAIVAAGGLPAADLAGRGAPPSRAALAAALLESLVAMAVAFEAGGFASFRDEWSAADALRDRPVRVLSHAAARDGVARGIDAGGELRVEFDGRVESLASGEVTLRAVA